MSSQAQSPTHFSNPSPLGKLPSMPKLTILNQRLGVFLSVPVFGVFRENAMSSMVIDSGTPAFLVGIGLSFY